MPTTTGKPGKRERLSLADRAYYAVRERILRGEIPLGAPLSRRRVAAELGMSLLPVSEAFQLLEADGLLESRPRVGTRVCFPTAERIRDQYEVREALESHAARLYAARVSAAEKREMKKMAEEMDGLFGRCEAAGRDFLYDVQSYHLKFHLRIAEIAGCRTLREMIERNHVLIFNWLFDVAASRPPLPPRFHRDLVAALNSGDVAAAGEAMRRHVRHGFDKIVEALGAGPRDKRFVRAK